MASPSTEIGWAAFFFYTSFFWVFLCVCVFVSVWGVEGSFSFAFFFFDSSLRILCGRADNRLPPSRQYNAANGDQWRPQIEKAASLSVSILSLRFKRAPAVSAILLRPTRKRRIQSAYRLWCCWFRKKKDNDNKTLHPRVHTITNDICVCVSVCQRSS